MFFKYSFGRLHIFMLIIASIIYLKIFYTVPALCENAIDIELLKQQLTKGLLTLVAQTEFKEHFGIQSNIVYLNILQEFIKDFVNSEKCINILLNTGLSSENATQEILELFFQEFAKANLNLASTLPQTVTFLRNTIGIFAITTMITKATFLTVISYEIYTVAPEVCYKVVKLIISYWK